MKKSISILVICILSINLNAQTKKEKEKPFGSWSAEIGYLISTNSTNTKDTKPLFAGNGLNAGVNYRWGNTLGIKSTLGFNGGKTNEKEIVSFAKTFEGNGFTAISSYSKSWSQFNFAAGPSIFLGKNYKGEISVLGGVRMGSERNIKIDLYDAAVFYKNVYNVTEKKVKPFWEVGASYQVANIKNIGFGIKGSYGSNGVSFGIVAWDWMACCAVKCKACPGLIPSKVIEK
ncbi:outer membrane protein with beta-barrel domain [Flavobacterium croceum DSM 17960]|uniref:Outer membrane protein with beta-barrel domain n=1 Tax=Flavobacterium croceum DSM 17960 TaxID=1121886 RepID=A0A2S4N520_9FLAO|nr:outer membrane beta-barrel protein [Flavobacterium croceum]POS00750.1 outer membrane protein with beta-barrel domain [Flavobacterium croceum DSM 17960]